MMQGLVNRLARRAANRPWAMMALVIGVSVLSAAGYIAPDWWKTAWNGVAAVVQSGPGADEATADEPQQVDPARNIQVAGLQPADVVLVVQADDFFNARATQALRAVAAGIEELPQVDFVWWLDDVPSLNLFGLSQPVLPRTEHASEHRFAAAREAARKHPMIYGQLLSDDLRTLLMMIDLNYYGVVDDSDVLEAIKQRAREVAAAYPDVGLQFMQTGRVPAEMLAIETHEKNQFFFQTIGYGMVLLMALVLFRGLRAVVIVALAPMVGVFWSIGFIEYLGYENNPLIDVIVPILVSLVGLTDGVHLMVQLRKLRAAGLEPVAAVEKSLSLVGLACFLTSLTTAVGFGSLTLADSRWVREFGQASVIGVVLSFLAVVTVIPLACRSPLGAGLAVGVGRSLVDRRMDRVAVLVEWALRHARPLSWLAIAGFLVCAGLTATMQPDQRNSDALPDHAEPVVALRHVDRAFGGLELARVNIAWDDGLPSDSAQPLEIIARVEQILAVQPLIGHPLSVRSFLDALPGEGPLEERLSLLELLPPSLKRSYFAPEAHHAVVTFRVQDLGIAAYDPVFRQVQQGLEHLHAEHPQFHFALTGPAVWRWENLYQIVVDLALSLCTAAGIILVILSIVFGSLRLGIISVIPNMLPIALTGAFLRLAGYNLEIVMVCSFTVCLGIAVDDTIHFLTRYLEERQAGRPVEEAIRYGFTHVGAALLMTTIVLVMGFGVVTFSDSHDHHLFALMGAMTVSTALVCDLVFLPALLKQFARRPASMESDAEAATGPGEDASSGAGTVASQTAGDLQRARGDRNDQGDDQQHGGGN
ncbi:MAG: RND transporter [Planctomycetota bacterium]|nr:MAG: RND transporter [Planctomycetota bacterium]